jgi:hypothetical protein
MLGLIYWKLMQYIVYCVSFTTRPTVHINIICMAKCEFIFAYIYLCGSVNPQCDDLSKGWGNL